MESEKAQSFQDLISASRHLARLIKIFDPDQPVAAGFSGFQIARYRGNQRAEVEKAGGRGSKAAAITGAAQARVAGNLIPGAGQKLTPVRMWVAHVMSIAAAGSRLAASRMTQISSDIDHPDRRTASHDVRDVPVLRWIA